MTQQMVQETHDGQQQLHQVESRVQTPAQQPVYFFDGDFRTWGQVVQRAQVNIGIAAYLAKHTFG